jgi:protein-tyrosine phosphatase
LWRRSQLNIVKSLLTADEVTELNLQAEQAITEAVGIEFYSFPIPDRGNPTSLVAARQFIETLEQQLSRGQNVAIHCRHGIGRSALIAAGLLVQSGLEPTTAWKRIEAVRGRPVPDTMEQKGWVERFASTAAVPILY